MRRQLIRLLFAGLVTRIDHSHRNYSRARRSLGLGGFHRFLRDSAVAARR
jgi:hypothetical protein